MTVMTSSERSADEVAPAVRTTPSGRPVRADIQALRALAVVLVVVTHAWPSFLPGGSVGVDVFFVISGYLITSLLAEEVSTHGRLRFVQFYLRRVARLLPLALVVVHATVVALWLWTPSFVLENNARHAIGASMYAVNWQLIADSASYATVDEGASALQHYWSLAVEEQYYVLFPLLLALLWRLRRRRAALFGIAVISAASLGLALGWRPDNPSATYFNTATRWWEFGAGAVLALSGWSVPHLWRSAARLAGLLLILYAASTVTDTTWMPGWATLTPVVGSVIMLSALPFTTVADESTSGRLLALAPIQYLGDTSYALYLWHWPVLIVADQLVEPTALRRAGLVVLALALAAASRPFEDRTRRAIIALGTRGQSRRPLALVAVLALAGSGLGAGTAVAVTHIDSPLRSSPPLAAPPVTGPTTTSTAGPSGSPSGSASPGSSSGSSSPGSASGSSSAGPKGSASCVGAGAMAPGASCPPVNAVSPDPQLARNDMPREECKESLGGSTVLECHIGEGSTQVALIGDSHAQRWLPALQELASSRDWTITTFLKSSCPFSAVPPVKYEAACAGWNAAALERLKAGKFTIAFVSNSVAQAYRLQSGDTNDSAAVRGLRGAWDPLLAQGTQVVVLKDTPIMGYGRIDPPACVLARGPLECAAEQSQVLRPDPMVTAAAQEPRVPVIDLTSFFCAAGRCPSVIGGILVYRDGQHMLSDYAKTLAPFLDDQLVAALR
ncbi:MAG: acyltransferase family protein [Tetrasphaera sp.]